MLYLKKKQKLFLCKHGNMSNTSSDILLIESLVKRNRCIEIVHQLIRFLCKTTTPFFFFITTSFLSNILYISAYTPASNLPFSRRFSTFGFKITDCTLLFSTKFIILKRLMSTVFFSFFTFQSEIFSLYMKIRSHNSPVCKARKLLKVQ